jgi:hypothetical protein
MRSRAMLGTGDRTGRSEDADEMRVD